MRGAVAAKWLLITQTTIDRLRLWEEKFEATKAVSCGWRSVCKVNIFDILTIKMVSAVPNRFFSCRATAIAIGMSKVFLTSEEHSPCFEENQ